MALAPFMALYELDISQHICQKPTFKKEGERFVKNGSLDYLPWTDCLVLLYKNGAGSVRYGNIHSANGHSLFLADGKCPEVHVYLEIDENRYELTYPLIDGSKDVSVSKMEQSDVHYATQRAFVKCAAVNTGLGLKLWEKEDKEVIQRPPREDPSWHNLRVVIDRVKQKYAAAVAQVGSEHELSSLVGISEKIIGKAFDGANNLGALEKRLDKVLRHDP